MHLEKDMVEELFESSLQMKGPSHAILLLAPMG